MTKRRPLLTIFQPKRPETTMISFIEESPGLWIFRHDYPEGADNELDASLDLLDAGKLASAEQRLRKLLLVCPEHIDALHHLALIFSRTGRELEAFFCCREAVRVGLEAIPRQFSWLTGRMLWGFLENRPFMRAYHFLGLQLSATQGPAKAREIFARLASVNPDDNLGARYLLMECHLDLADWEAALALAHQYPHDSSAEFLYSKIVALVQLEREDEAIDSILSALQYAPKVAEELLKTRHIRPKEKAPSYVETGSSDEAFTYWERNKRHWSKSSPAFLLLRKIKLREA